MSVNLPTRLLICTLQKFPVSKSASAPDQRLSPIIPNTLVATHDYHLQTPAIKLPVSKTRKDNSSEISSSNEHTEKANAYVCIEKGYIDHIKPASLLREHKTKVAQAVEKVQRQKGAKRRKQPKELGELVKQVPEHYPTLEQIIHGEKDIPICSEESVSTQSERHLRARTASDNYLPVTVSSFCTVTVMSM